MSIKAKYRLEYGLLRSAVFFVNLLPITIINGITASLAWLAWVFLPFRLPVAYDNLSTIFPDMSHDDKLKLLRKAYRQFLHAAGLILVIHRKNIGSMIENAAIRGLDKLDEALAEGKGVILTTYHGCWFEPYFAWFSKGHRPTSLIYQQQSNPLSDAFFVRQRQRYGTNLTHLHSLEKLHVYEDALRSGHILIVSLDQNYTDNGVPVTLFGKQFVCARGTGLLHLKTGAPVLTSVYYVRNGRLHIDFDTVKLPEYDTINDETIGAITNTAISGYETTIRTYPQQWFSLFHRLWKKDGYPKKIPRNLRQIIGFGSQ